MPALRHLAVLLTVGLLALTGAAPAVAQSAGDEQYSDPLAGQSSRPAAPSKAPSLTQTPRGSGAQTPRPSAPAAGSGGSGSSGGGSGAAGSAPAQAGSSAPAAPTGAATARELPRTGLDTGAIAGLGAALLLLGIGLRLRTADVRF